MLNNWHKPPLAVGKYPLTIPLRQCFLTVKAIKANSVTAQKFKQRCKQMENAIIYARYSSTGQNEQSIEGQVRICREFAENKGFTVVKTYIDKAKTGTNDNRPDFQKMVLDAASGTFKYVIVYMFDRFARKQAHPFLQTLLYLYYKNFSSYRAGESA